MVIPDDPRIGIGLYMMPDPGGFKQNVRIVDYYPSDTVAMTSTATGRKFGRVDDDVLVRFNPCNNGTTRKWVQQDFLMKKQASVRGKWEKQLFLDHSVAEAAGERIFGGSLGHFGSALATPDDSNASIM
jgi:hypothetical protein